MHELNLPDSVVSVKWLKNNIDNKNLVVLDGTINKVINDKQKQIPKARYFDIKTKFSNTADPFPSAFPSEAQFQKEARALGINKKSTIVIYDDKGIYSSARVWWMFKAFGHDKVAVLNGGFPKWLEVDYHTEPLITYNGEEGDFEAKLKPDYMLFFEDIKNASQNSSYTIIDARSAARFNMEEPEPREGLRMGTIPNSKNLPYTDLLEDGKIKDKVDLEKQLNMVARKEDNVIFSCGSGITACILALGAYRAGYNNISVYDGSWTEWGTLVGD